MNTQHFKYALEVEKTGSITQAAENLFMGQPNLSKSIKELEDTLGIVIFKRTSRGVVPTDKGREFLRYAKNILLQVNELENACKSDIPDMQTCNICVPRGSYAAYAAAEFIAGLDGSKPIDVNLGETTSIDGVNMVSDGVFNIGVVRYQTAYEKYFMDFFHEKNLVWETVWEYESLAAMSERHPLADKEELVLSDFEPYIEITHGDCNVPYINVAQSENMSLSIYAKKVINLYEGTNQFFILSQMPGSFMWVSPTPADLLSRYSLVQRHCNAPAHKYKDVMIYREGCRLGNLEKKFMNKLYEIKNSLSFGVIS